MASTVGPVIEQSPPGLGECGVKCIENTPNACDDLRATMAKSGQTCVPMRVQCVVSTRQWRVLCAAQRARFGVVTPLARDRRTERCLRASGTEGELHRLCD